VKLRTKFFLSLLAVLLVMAVPALYAVGTMRAVRSIALDLRERAAEAAFVVGRTQADLERLDRYQRAHVATGEPELAASARATLDALDGHLDRLRETGYADAVDVAAPTLSSLRAVSDLTTLLMEAGHSDLATQSLRLSVVPQLQETSLATGALAAAVDDLTRAELARVDSMTGDAVAATTAALLIAFLVAIGLALLAARFLTRPLNELATSMARVADGRLDPPRHLPYDRRDEVGDLFRAFRSMARQLSDLDRMKAQVVSIASHDMKTPVNVITGYAELMKEEVGPQLDERHRAVIDSLYRQARTLGARVNQLLEVSRIEASGLRPGLEEINVRHFTAELARAQRTVAARHGIEIETEVDDSAPTFLIADPDCLRNEVFANLFENSLRFTPRGGHIQLKVSGYGGLVIFEMADDGPSIPADALPGAFDRYYRGGKASGRIGGGLGLPIARAGAEAHGGTIDATSPETGGTVFRITLPIHPTLHAEGTEYARKPR
jgi:signal transduction histidine kinase